MKNLSFIIISILTLQTIFSIQLFAQKKEEGKLAQFEKEVEKKSKSKNSHSSVKVDFECDDDIAFDDSMDVANFVEGTVMLIGLGYYTTKTALNLLFVFPKEIENGYWDVGYSDYPYSNSSIGIYNINSDKKYSVYSSMSYFRENSSMNALNFNARLSPTPVISFEINYSDFTEKLRTRYDHLRMYDVFINYNRVKLDNFALWWGIGFKGIMGDRSIQALALNFGANIFIPTAPVSLSLIFNVGYFDVNNVYDFSPKIRYHIERAEISLGYRKYSAGQISINGWTLGLGFYL